MAVADPLNDYAAIERAAVDGDQWALGYVAGHRAGSLAAAGAGAEVDRAYPEVECPGMFIGWSAFGATYPDTVCATSLTWPEGHDPGLVLCDADDDHRPKGIPCPACDPQRFAQYEDDPIAPLAIYRLTGLLAARGDAPASVRCAWCERRASGTAEHSDGLRHPACPEHGLPGTYRGDAATPTVTAEKMLDAWAEAVADGVRGTTPWRFLAALGIEVEGGEQRG